MKLLSVIKFFSVMSSEKKHKQGKNTKKSKIWFSDTELLKIKISEKIKTAINKYK